METTESADGTTIAFDRTGSGPALVMVRGAFNTRFSTKSVTALLASDFTVFEYDRRGRGDSGDAPVYAIEREVEDLAAIVQVAGESPFVFGHSSGAALALEAAARGVRMRKLAVYEPPYTGPGPSAEFAKSLRELVDAGNADQAARDFLATTGVPPQGIEQIAQGAWWPNMVALAHTLPYDVLLCNGGAVPVERLANVTVPTLALAGGASAPWAARVAREVAAAIPGAHTQVVEGQDHNIADDALVPVLKGFFA
jgi:pimeloyl-ACP methyl ester carboxylesterase